MSTRSIKSLMSDRCDTAAAISVELGKIMRKHIDAATKTCLNCEHFFEKNELCRFNGINQRPPARVIVTGCPAHQDEIPF